MGRPTIPQLKLLRALTRPKSAQYPELTWQIRDFPTGTVNACVRREWIDVYQAHPWHHDRRDLSLRLTKLGNKVQKRDYRRFKTLREYMAVLESVMEERYGKETRPHATSER